MFDNNVREIEISFSTFTFEILDPVDETVLITHLTFIVSGRLEKARRKMLIEGATRQEANADNITKATTLSTGCENTGMIM